MQNLFPYLEEFQLIVLAITSTIVLFACAFHRWPDSVEIAPRRAYGRRLVDLVSELPEGLVIVNQENSYKNAIILS